MRYVLALTLLMTLTASNAYAWGKPDAQGSPLTMKDFVPTLIEDEAYIERYTFSVDMDGGGYIGADFTISNLGWGNHHGAARIRIQLPNQKGMYRYATPKLAADKWKHDRDKFDITMGTARVFATGPKTFRLEFTHPKDGTKLKLDFTNNLPMWRPGQGAITVPDGFLKYQVLAPRASVRGTVTRNGKTHNVLATRNAWADHANTNIAPFDFAKRFARFRAFNKDVTLAWREIKLETKYGARSLTWMLVGYKDQIVYSDASAKIRFGQTRQDATTGYVLPYAVQVDGAKGKDSVKIVLKGKRMKKHDLLESYGAAAKMVASAVSKPFRYDFPCAYTMQMTIQGATATIRGRGRYSIDYVNP